MGNCGLWSPGSLYTTEYGSCVACGPLVFCTLLPMEAVWPVVPHGSLYLTDYGSCVACGPLVLCILLTMEAV